MQANSLHSAVCAANEQLARALVAERAAAIDAQDDAGCTPLYLAAERGLTNILKLLVQSGADVDLGNSVGVTPLIKACWNGHVEIVEQLLNAGASTLLQDQTGQTPLYAASEFGHLPIVQMLLQTGAELDDEDKIGATPLFIAAESDQSEVVDTLIRSGADVDHVMWFNNLTPTNTASWAGRAATVALLAEAGANLAIPNKRGVAPLGNASVQNRLETVNCLLRYRADPNATNKAGETAIHMASGSGFTDIVASLIRARADVNISDTEGSCPLHVAARNGHAEIVSLLIKAKADILCANKKGETPLLLACAYLNEPVVRCMLSADLHVSTATRKSCLELYSSYKDHPTVLRIKSLLVDYAARESEGPQRQSMSTESHRQFSQKLFDTLCDAGFTAERARFQGAISHVLEQITTNCLNLQHHLTGSYGDGWGNNLSCLNGTTSLDSDIDFTRIIPGSCFHISGSCCRCDVVDTSQVGAFVNGHVTCAVTSSVTAESSIPSRLRPANDYVFAIRCCRYPHVPVLEPENRGFLSEQLVQQLQTELESGDPCHLIRAASPGRSGREMRISTTFLERLFMRGLSTVQGQLFVIIKYLIKRVMSQQVKGLKSYHAKTLIFHMVHDTPPNLWQPENLVQLTLQSLKQLVKCLRMEIDPRVCMRHFFYPDAPLYFKKYSSPKDTVLECLENVKCHLSSHLSDFLTSLRTLGCPNFYFHPFSLLPLQKVAPTRGLLGQFGGQYYQLYDCVAQLLLCLSANEANDNKASLLHLLDSLPDCAYTTRECIRVMLLLRGGDLNAAQQILRNKFLGKMHRVQRSILHEEPANTQTVNSQLVRTDSAWRFVFRIDERLQLPYLPTFVQKIFPEPLGNYVEFFYFNFNAAVMCLCFELLPGEVSPDDWFQELQKGADFVELFAFSHYSGDPHQLETAHDAMASLSCSYDSVIFGVKEKLVTMLRRPT